MIETEQAGEVNNHLVHALTKEGILTYRLFDDAQLTYQL